MRKVFIALFRRGCSCGGVLSYLPEDIYREIAYIAYHFHWAKSDVMSMTHHERKIWIKEIADINKKINTNMENQIKAYTEKSDLEMQ